MLVKCCLTDSSVRGHCNLVAALQVSNRKVNFEILTYIIGLHYPFPPKLLSFHNGGREHFAICSPLRVRRQISLLILSEFEKIN